MNRERRRSIVLIDFCNCQREVKANLACLEFINPFPIYVLKGILQILFNKTLIGLIYNKYQNLISSFGGLIEIGFMI